MRGTSGESQPPSGDKLAGLPPFCRVSIVSKPAAGSHIKIELWLPEGSWNSRLLGAGNGGGAGGIIYGSLAVGTKRGFATVSAEPQPRSVFEKNTPRTTAGNGHTNCGAG